MRTRVFVCLVVLVAFAGCSDSAKSYASSADIVDALAAEGFDCANETLLVDADLVKDGVTCSHDGVGVRIYTFSSDEDLASWLAVADKLGPVAFGPDWALTSDESNTKTAGDLLRAEFSSP
jgi:hypothetical protein